MNDYTNSGEFEDEGYTFLYYLIDNNLLEPKYNYLNVDKVPLVEVISLKELYYYSYLEFCYYNNYTETKLI